MSFGEIALDALIEPAPLERAGDRDVPILSMTMHEGLVDQASKFKKRVASTDTADYKLVRRNQLVVGFPIDEGVLSFQCLYDAAIVSPAYDIWNLRRTHEIEPTYLERFLRSPRALAYYRTKLRGTAARRRTLPDDIFLKLPVPLPSLTKQRRIAEILDRADALRAKRRTALAQLDTLTQSIFFSMFGDPATNPKEWPVMPLGNLMTEVYRYPTYYDIQYVKDGVPEIRGELLNEDGTVVTDAAALRYISPDTSMRFPRTVLAAGDLVISVRGTVGKIAIVPVELAGANMTANLLRLAPDRKQVSPLYAWHYMQTAWFRAQLNNACSNTTIRTIKAPDLKRIGVMRPPIDRQTDFDRIIRSIREQKERVAEAVSDLDSFFSSIQYRAFRGQL